MTEAARAATGRIFLSYRREETAYAAGWLYDRLTDHFGHGQVFKDVDSIELGDDFVDAVTTAVGSCDVLLALIGDRWLTITGVDGRRRLEDPGDFVRLEVETALTRGVRVVPILVAGARMPEARDLPPCLARLVRRQALELSPSHFDADLIRLLRVLDVTLVEAREEAAQHEAAGSGRNTPAAAGPGPATWPLRPRGTAGGAGPATQPTEMRTRTWPPWYRRLLGYGRFWFGLLFVLAGVIALLANAPHYYGYEKFPSVAHLHLYIELGLAVLVLAGVLLLTSALIAAAGPSGTPRNPGPTDTG